MATLSNIEKMFQAIINGLSAFKIEVNARFDKVDKKIDGLDKKIDGAEERLTKRIDGIGKQLAYLEDDAPTREEFESLEKKVDRHIRETSHSHGVN